MLLMKKTQVFKKILDDFQNLDLCVFNAGMYDPKLEKEINKEQIKLYNGS